MKKLMRTLSFVVVLLMLLSMEAMTAFALSDGISSGNAFHYSTKILFDDPVTGTTTPGGTDPGTPGTDPGTDTGGNEDLKPDPGPTVTPPETTPEPEAPPIQLVISNAPPTIAIGDTATISYVLSNAPAGTQIIWSSNNPGAVSVDGSGNITGISPGTAVITAATGDVSASCTVTATETKAESIEIAVKEFNAADKLVKTHEIKVGDILHLSVSAKPKDAATPNVSWKVSVDEVASITQKGELEALKKGKFTVTAIGGENDELKATIDFEVTDGGFNKKYILLIGIALLLAAITATIITIFMRRGKKQKGKSKRGGGGGGRSASGARRRDPRRESRYDDDDDDDYEEESETERIRREAYMRGYRDREEEDLTLRSSGWKEERDRSTKIYTGQLEDDDVWGIRGSGEDDYSETPFTFDDFDSDR